MPIGHITNDRADRLSRGDTLWDDEVKGFGVRRQRKAIVYILKYSSHGRQRFVTLGHHCSDYSADDARNDAVKRRAVLAARPQGDQKIDDSSGSNFHTFAEVAEKYMLLHATVHKEKRSLAEDRRNLDLHILPYLGSMRFDAITRGDIVALHASRGEHRTNANRCLALVSHIFTIAGRWENLPAGNNPCRGIKRYEENRRDRRLSGAELFSLRRSLDSVDPWKGFTPFPEDWRSVQAIRLLLATGAPLKEICGLEWESIEWEAGFARQVTRDGPRKIPLPAPALAILRAIRERHPTIFQSKSSFCWTAESRFGLRP